MKRQTKIWCQTNGSYCNWACSQRSFCLKLHAHIGNGSIKYKMTYYPLLCAETISTEVPLIYLVPWAFLHRGENGCEKTLASADRRNFKHSEKLAVINSIPPFNRCGGAVAVSAVTDISGKNAMNADRSLNSLLNSLPLVKCYFVTPNFSGFLKIRLFSRPPSRWRKAFGTRFKFPL